MEGGGNPVPPLLWEAMNGSDGGVVVFGKYFLVFGFTSTSSLYEAARRLISLHFLFALILVQ